MQGKVLTAKRGNDGKPIIKARKSAEDREKIEYGPLSGVARFFLAEPDIDMDPAPKPSRVARKKKKSSSKKK